LSVVSSALGAIDATLLLLLIESPYQYHKTVCDVTPLCVQTWIREKAKLIESTDELDNDLAGVITLQRRLSGLQRDLAAIQAKLDSLNQEAEQLSEEKPEEAEAIRTKTTQITELWMELKQMVRISYLAGLRVLYGWVMDKMETAICR